MLFTSGYTENAIVHGGRLDAGVELLPKPYSREDLARKIRHVLANQQQRNQAEAPPSPSRAAPSEMPVVTAGKAVTWTILLVEDDDLIRSSTAEMLAELGHAVVQAGNAASALQALESEPVDVLVTDIGLPDLPGDELARRARKVRPGLGVVFATGDTAISTEHELEATVLLVKPYNGIDLARALASLDSDPELDAAE